MAGNRPARRRRDGTAITIELLPDRGGAWLQIRSHHQLRYDIQYFVIGTAGHQRYGSIRGNLSSSVMRRFVDLNFDVVVAGITWQRLTFGPGRSIEVEGPAVPPRHPSFRPMHPSLTSAARVRLPVAGRQRRTGTVRPYESAGPYGSYIESYGIYAEPYLDPYALYGALAYQDFHGAYLEGIGEGVSDEKTAPVKRKRKPSGRPKMPNRRARHRPKHKSARPRSKRKEKRGSAVPRKPRTKAGLAATRSRSTRQTRRGTKHKGGDRGPE